MHRKRRAGDAPWAQSPTSGRPPRLWCTPRARQPSCPEARVHPCLFPSADDRHGSRLSSLVIRSMRNEFAHQGVSGGHAERVGVEAPRGARGERCPRPRRTNARVLSTTRAPGRPAMMQRRRRLLQLGRSRPRAAQAPSAGAPPPPARRPSAGAPRRAPHTPPRPRPSSRRRWRTRRSPRRRRRALRLLDVVLAPLVSMLCEPGRRARSRTAGRRSTRRRPSTPSPPPRPAAARPAPGADARATATSWIRSAPPSPPRRRAHLRLLRAGRDRGQLIRQRHLEPPWVGHRGGASRRSG